MVFYSGKDGFYKNNRNFSSKKKFSREKDLEVAFYSGKHGFYPEKQKFYPVKSRFSCGKQHFGSKIVFYSEKLSF